MSTRSLKVSGMRKTFFATLAALVVGSLLGLSVAYAARPAPPAEVKNQEFDFLRGIKVGPSGAQALLTNTTTGSLDYDFPTMGGTLLALDTTCLESSAVTVTGARFGDTCVVGVDQVHINGFGQFTAYVTAADTAKVQACASGISDGGSFNMPDAGYKVRCFGP